jgi:hypothetical protein
MKSLVQRSAVVLAAVWWICSADLVKAASAPGPRLVEQRKAEAAKREMIYLTKEEPWMVQKGRLGRVHPRHNIWTSLCLRLSFRNGARITASIKEVLRWSWAGRSRLLASAPTGANTPHKLILRYDLKTMAADGGSGRYDR